MFLNDKEQHIFPVGKKKKRLDFSANKRKYTQIKKQL
jgi:hypothetical protein